MPILAIILAAVLPTIAFLGLFYKIGQTEGRMTTRLENIEGQFKTNGGTTIKDDLVAVKTWQAEHAKHHNGVW